VQSHAALIKLLALEQRILRQVNLPFGVSIVALARPDKARSGYTKEDLAKLFALEADDEVLTNVCKR